MTPLRFATRRRMMASLFSACVVAAIGLASAAYKQPAVSDPKNSLRLQPCDVAGVTGEGRCGTFDVYENRSTRTGRRIGLNVVVLPALGAASSLDPVFWLEGGPGAAATQAMGPVSQRYLQGLRADRDLVFVDQRGTGKSSPLTCDDIGETPANLDRYFGKLFPIDAIRACRAKLEKVADLTLYSTTIAMDDLDEVRRALGYETINLAGASYGTLAAQVYMRQHPDRVRSAFLIGVATPGFKLPLPFARAAQNALEHLFVDCAADPACRAAFPNIRDEFAAVLARFDRGPMVVTMTDPGTGRERPVTLERESYVERLRTLLYSTNAARFIPLVVHQAFLHDFRPFQTIATRYSLGGALSRGMYFSVTCSEMTPFITEEEIAAETRGTFLGDRRVRAHLAACGEWPRGRVPRSFLEPVRSEIPVILFSGEADGATPPWIAEAAVGFLPNGLQIKAPHTGHQIDGPCTWDLMQAFIRNPAARQLDAGCVAKGHRPPFATAISP
jgi:pimeloyl-ACP methyl ester carboxylesterase